MNHSSQPILLVEDSPEDYHAAVRAFKRAGLQNQLFRCENSEDALDFLYGRGAFSAPEQAPRPGLILLDLNLPGTDGREVLQQVKSTASLRSIPIVVMTTSSDERDVEACYDHGANSYLVKPVELNGLNKAIQRLKDYWFDFVVLPGN